MMPSQQSRQDFINKIVTPERDNTFIQKTLNYLKLKIEKKHEPVNIVNKFQNSSKEDPKLCVNNIVSKYLNYSVEDEKVFD
jgi:hypothetical protein